MACPALATMIIHHDYRLDERGSHRRHLGDADSSAMEAGTPVPLPQQPPGHYGLRQQVVQFVATGAFVLAGSSARSGDLAHVDYDEMKVATYAGCTWKRRQSGQRGAEETQLDGQPILALVPMCGG
jgi:hypothetical protein